jgi:hypothetical protein
LVEKSAFLLLLFFCLNIGIYRYLPVFGIGVLDITIFEKFGIFAISRFDHIPIFIKFREFRVGT